MRIHSVVAKERSVPRFFCYIQEEYEPADRMIKPITVSSEIVKNLFGMDGHSIEEAKSMDEEEYKDCFESHSPIAEEIKPDVIEQSGSDSSDYDPIELLRDKNTDASDMFEALLRQAIYTELESHATGMF